MLLSAVITLDPLDDAARRTNVRQVQRWFKDSFEAADAALFAALHKANEARPYTLSDVFLPQDGRPAWLRITSLDERLSALLADRLLPDAQRAGEIVFDPRGGQARFAVRGVDLGSPSRPPFAPASSDFHAPATWAGRSGYGELVTAVMKQSADPSPVLSLYFHTCTSFRLNAPEGFKSNLPLPVPRYVFQSALRQWEALSPAHLRIPIAPFLEHYVWVSHFQIRVARAAFVEETQKVVGFTGRVEFGLAWRDKLPLSMRRDWRHYVDVLRLLSAFAFYAGTGAQTTRGLGQTLPIESENRSRASGQEDERP